MIEQTFQIHLFYPLLFIFLTIVVVTIGLVIKGRSSDFTFKDIFIKHDDNNKDIFFRHSEEHEDTTSKMKDMHTEVVDGIPTQYQHELHSIEETVKKETTRLDKLVEDMTEINHKLDILLEWKFETERAKRK